MRDSFRRSWAVVVRNLFVWARNLDSLAETIWYPSIEVLTWGFMTIYFQGAQGTTSQIVSYFIGGLILWMFVYRSQTEMGYAFLQEFWDRNLLNVLVTPITIWEFLLGAVGVGSIKLCISVVWTVVMTVILFHFSLYQLTLVIIPLILSLLLVGWAIGLVINGLIVRFGYQIQAIAWAVVFIFQPFSAVFYPVSIMPSWMQKVVRFVPTSYVFEDMRTLLGGDSVSLNSIMLALGMSFAYFLVGLFIFKFLFKRALQKGMIVKFS